MIPGRGVLSSSRIAGSTQCPLSIRRRLLRYPAESRAVLQDVPIDKKSHRDVSQNEYLPMEYKTSCIPPICKDHQVSIPSSFLKLNSLKSKNLHTSHVTCAPFQPYTLLHHVFLSILNTCDARLIRQVRKPYILITSVPFPITD
jgi:hypothetical protein